MHRPPAVLLALLLVLSACAAEDGPGVARTGPVTETPTSPPAQPATTSSTAGPKDSTATTSPAPLGEITPVIAVLDGDSIAVERDGRRTEVRLAGINAPEADECHGEESRTRIQEIAGEQVILVEVEGEEDVDQYGRLLRNVWSGGTWLNLTMVHEGAALTLQTGTIDEPTLLAAEDEAWRQGLGMWGSAVCGEFAQGIGIADIRYDPPGRDYENAADEYVVFANSGDAAVDAGGWIVRDESSTHRYQFPSGFTFEPGAEIRLRTGCGTDTATDLYWCAGDAVWSNGGDTVILQAANGTVVDRWKYAGDF